MGQNSSPIWAPDGERVLFSSNRTGSWGLYTKPADGGGEAVELVETAVMAFPTSWSARDGLIAFTESNGTGELLSVERGREPTRLSYPQTFGEWGHRFSPDGRWLAYLSDRDGAQEVWVRPIPAMEPEYKVSAGGGAEPIWLHDGNELLFRNGNQWMVTDVTTDPSFSSTSTRELFQTPFVDTYGVSWDLAPDG